MTDPRPPISERTLTPYGGYPAMWQRSFYRTTGYDYIRCRVKHNADGSKEEAVEEAMTPDGPWYWCDEPTHGATK